MIRKLMVVLLITAICLLGAIPALAQRQYVTLEEYKEVTGKKIEKFNEAPMLRAMVAAGGLPPVEERLPEEPLVVEPVEEIGQYGGTWNRVWLGPSDRTGVQKIAGEQMIRFNVNGTKVLPNIAKSWDVSEEGKVYTFHLRKGIKWSDGVPFTADDILFYYEDVLLNKEITPVFPTWLTVGKEPVKVEKIDDYTVRFRFVKPYGLFLGQMAYRGTFYAPKHYMKQFHPRYTPMDKLEEMTKEAGFQYWYQLYSDKGAYGWFVTNPSHPTIWAWKAVTECTGSFFRMERNPYFWKVDPQGNQLPYIDHIRNNLVESGEMVSLKAMAGEIDMQNRHLQLADYPLLMANRERGDYRVFKWILTDGSRVIFMPNLNCKDPVLRKIFQDDRFRKALSLAINRQEMNELLYLGLGKPQQASFMEGTPYFSAEWEKAYAEYDPQKANEFLDEMGLKWDEKHEYRLRPDGKTLKVTIIFTTAFAPDWADACDLVKRYWKTIGVKVALKPMERSLLTVRTQANEYEIYVWSGYPIFPVCSDMPVPKAGSNWAPEYGRWYETGGKAGEKPTGDVAKLLEIWDKIKVTVDEEKKKQLIQDFVKLHIKNIWLIGTVGKIPLPAVVKNNFRNVPEEILVDDTLRTPGNAQPWQFFIKQK